MTNKILKDEMLSEEQLGLVAGGTAAENRVDVAFFHRLGYDMTRTGIAAAYIENGVNYFGNSNSSNYYSLKVKGEWCKHPHFVALGYVLSKSLITAEKILRLRSEDFFQNVVILSALKRIRSRKNF